VEVVIRLAGVGAGVGEGVVALAGEGVAAVGEGVAAAGATVGVLLGATVGPVGACQSSKILNLTGRLVIAWSPPP
jgi:hypothetical protein